MIAVNKDTGLQLEIPDVLLNQLYQEGLNHYPKEFGGILVGRYSEDLKKCIVEATILPISFKSSRNGFERGNNGIRKILTEYYNRVPSLVYIGEWHTHPDASHLPSETDRKAMFEIEAHEEVKISSPVLIILGLNKTKYTVGCYVQHLKKLYTYEKN